MLVGDNPQKTIHPRIQKISEFFTPFDQLEVDLNKLKSLLEDNKVNEIKDLLFKILKIDKSDSKIVDHIYKQETLLREYNQNLSFKKDSENKVIKIR